MIVRHSVGHESQATLEGSLGVTLLSSAGGLLLFPGGGPWAGQECLGLRSSSPRLFDMGARNLRWLLKLETWPVQTGMGWKYKI